jgi:predicted aspartyl protease
MSISFNPVEGLITIRVTVNGPSGDATLLAILDTGANVSVIDNNVLFTVGYQVDHLALDTPVLTGNGTILAAKFTLDSFSALGKEKRNFPVVCCDLPPVSPVDAIVGLDFLRNHILTLDFTTGKLTLV